MAQLRPLFWPRCGAGAIPPNCCPRSVDEGSSEVLRDKAEELAAAHVVGSDQAQRSMPDVLDFPFHGGGRAHRDVGIPAFKCLHPGLCECERAGRVHHPPITPPSISGRPNPLRITPPSISGRPNPLRITPPSISARPNPLRITRRVFMGAGAPKLLRRSPPHFSVAVQHGTNCGESGTTCYGTCPGPSAFVQSRALGGALPNCCPPFRRRRFGCRGPPDKAEELAAAHVVGTHPEQRPMPDVLDFPCVPPHRHCGKSATRCCAPTAILPFSDACMSTRPTARSLVPGGGGCGRVATPCTQTNSAQVKRPWSRPQRQAVRCLPGAWVETGHAALPGPGQSRMQPAASRAQTPRKSASRPGGSTTRPPWPVDPEPAPPAGTTPPADPCRGVAPRRLAAMATEGGTCADRH